MDARKHIEAVLVSKEQEKMKEDMIEAYKDQQINDKIMAFAQKEHRIGTIDNNPGTGLKRVSKPGVQRFKY